MTAQTLQTLLVSALPMIFAVVFHEVAHGFAADKLGDSTARLQGRLSLNPLNHIDPFGTILLPGLLVLTGAGFVFGWAKPVPVHFGHLRKPRRDMVLVAAAGPGANLAMAAVCAFVLRAVFWAVPELGDYLRYGGAAAVPMGGGLLFAKFLAQMAVVGLQWNVSLAVFNMVPIPPLDGGRVAVGVLPFRPALALAKLEPYGMFLVIALLWLNPLGLFTGVLGFLRHAIVDLLL